MTRDALQDNVTPYRRLLGQIADLIFAAAIGVALGYALNPYVVHRMSFVAGVAAGGGTGAGLWAWRSGRPRPLVDALLAAAGAALGVYLGIRWLG